MKMISFSCASCGKTFTVPDEFAGRAARCKGCGEKLTVPAAPRAVVEEPTQIPAKMPMRMRRLIADAATMSSAFRDFPFIQVQPIAGNPPETYRIRYKIKGLESGKNGSPIPRENHEVEIQLTSEYPRMSPACRMLTPIFHPNIDPVTICVGDHWTAGEQLPDLVVRIGQMIAYQEYNIKSPLNAEAAMWADLNGGQLPIDSTDLRPPGI